MISQRFGITDSVGEARLVAESIRPVMLSFAFSLETLPPRGLRSDGAEHESMSNAIAGNAQPYVDFRLMRSIEHSIATEW